MATKYKCIKCGNGVSGGSHPLIGNCSRGGGHQWIVEDGARKKYKCIKCGNGVSGTSHPLIGTCSRGGGHEWVS